jgi:type I restriction enzyme R subunit
LTPLLKLKYNALEDAMRELGEAALIRQIFIGFQKYLYQSKPMADNRLGASRRA